MSTLPDPAQSCDPPQPSPAGPPDATDRLPEAARPARRRRWKRIIIIALLGAAATTLLLFGSCVTNIVRARSVAHAQKPNVLKILAGWDLDELYRVAPALEPYWPADVAGDYFDLWRRQLGPAQSLAVVGYHFRAMTGRPTLMVAVYDGVFARGTDRITAHFTKHPDGWSMVGFYVGEVAPSRPTTPARATPPARPSTQPAAPVGAPWR